MQRTIVAMLTMLLVLAVAACGGGGGTNGPETAPDATSSPDAGSGGTGYGSTGGGDQGGIPSGARVRIFNAYAEPDGTPVALDVYPEPWVLEGATPLLTVEYGTLSPVFDPTVADEAGNMFLSAYAKGETGNGNSVMSTTQTLTGSEVITYVVARGTGEMANGRAGSVSQAWFDPTVAGTDGQTPAPGKGRVVVSAVGLDNVLDREGSWFASFGGGCARGINDDESSRALIAPGTNETVYDLDPGTHAFSLHRYDAQPVPPTCAGAADFGAVEVAVQPGAVSLLFLYAPTADDLRAVVVPLSAP